MKTCMNTTPTNWPQNFKKTLTRLEVWGILSASKLPLTAAEIFQQLLETGDSYCLATVYRTLEAFVNHNMVSKTYVGDATKAHYLPLATAHIHYGICVRCHTRMPMAGCPFDRIEINHSLPIRDENNLPFHVTGHNLELFGYCETCFSQGG